MLVYYNERPEQLVYEKLPDGSANVWLRKDIKIIPNDDPESQSNWQAEEIYFKTRQSQSEIENNLSAIFIMKFNVQDELVAIVQKYMDETVQTRGYDNIVSACSYANSTDSTFSAEGLACVAWRDSVWRTCYNILDAVKLGTHKIPTAEELIEELPKLEW